MRIIHRFAPALAALVAAGAVCAQPAPPQTATSSPPPASVAPAAANPENLAMAQRIVAPIAPMLEAALAPVCSGDDLIGRAKTLPTDQKAKAIAAAQPICLSGVKLVQSRFVDAAARAFTLEDLQSIYDFTRSPQVVSVLAGIASNGPTLKPTDEQKAALKADLERFIVSPAGQQVRAHSGAFVAILKADLLPRVMALQAEVEAAACQAGGCPPS